MVRKGHDRRPPEEVDLARGERRRRRARERRHQRRAALLLPCEPARRAEEAVNSLVVALRKGTQGRDMGTKSALTIIERAIEMADAAGADPEKLRVAREVVANRGRSDRASRFW